jgi:GDSL-like Lipase/Acylhydrolase family
VSRMPGVRFRSGALREVIPLRAAFARAAFARAAFARAGCVLAGFVLTISTPIAFFTAGATPAEAHRQAPAPPSSSYVALGDSFASGEGLPPFEAGTGGVGGCHRSARQSYPELLSAEGQRVFRQLESVACSGAVTADLVTGSTEPPQLDALGPRTRTVTITIGGDDAGFSLVLGDCVYSPDPDVQAALPGRGPGCAARDDAVVSARIAALSGAPGAPQIPGIVPLPAVLDRVAAASPRATIYLTGYPTLFGTRASDAAGCRVSSAAPLYVAPTDAAWIRAKASALNAAIRSAATRARLAGVDVRYVDVARTFRGHDLCDRKSAWINGVMLASTQPLVPSSATFHPTARGQRGFALAVRKSADARRWSHAMVARP